MQGNEEVMATLNQLLADELTAINQYMVHAEMCDNWGYEELDGVIQARAITEMKHAEKLIARLLFLEGKPIVSNLNPIHIGADVAAPSGKLAQLRIINISAPHPAPKISCPRGVTGEVTRSVAIKNTAKKVAPDNKW